MRACIIALAFLAIVATGILAQAPPTHPIPDVNKGDMDMCMLDNIGMDGGLSIVGSFSSGKFEYTCSCTDWSKIGYGAGSPRLMISLADQGSTADVWFNGQVIHHKSLGTGLTGDGNLWSNNLASAANQWKVGSNLVQIGISCMADPVTGKHMCRYNYEVECIKPPESGGSVSGDPQFVGLRGQEYQVHGVDGEIYNIVSDSDLQYNSKFVFLSSGKCPVVNGRKQKVCYSHPGSYLGELGLKTRAGDQIHLVSGDSVNGFDTVEVNGRELEIGETVILADDMGSVSRNNTHLASVQVGNWDFEFENSDMFVNQKVRVFDARALRSHGLLGQTWSDKTYSNSIKHIQGSVDDYVIRDQDIFGDNFVFNAFN